MKIYVPFLPLSLVADTLSYEANVPGGHHSRRGFPGDAGLGP